MNIPLEYVVKVIGFYKLHYCNSNETDEFFQILAYFTGH